MEQVYNDIALDASIDWEDLYSDLKDERTILVLGPDFHIKNDLSIKIQLYNELKSNVDNGILHFNPNNGIYLFKSPRYKNKAQKAAVRFYNNIDADVEILQKVIDLPFRMIINANPDKLLVSKYHERGIACQFEYFTWRPNRKERPITDPDKYYPLVFNLFGSVDSFESIVLDFEDVFDHLKALLNNINVSNIIRAVLNEAETFIFIGFHLAKWDTQLLFRYLNMKEHSFDDTKKNYTTPLYDVDSNLELFYRQQFNLKYYGAPVEFINDLHQKYFEMSEKDVFDNSIPLVNLIEKLVARDDIENALNVLSHHYGQVQHINDEIIMIRSNHSRYMYRETRKLDNSETLTVERNRIKYSILDLSKNLQ